MMITRRDFGKLGVGAAAVVKISPYLLFSGGDAHGQTTSGEGGDIRRVGARSNGTYWGHGGERVDLLSGNLSYSFALLLAQSRSCGASVRLSYNSQMWKQGLAGPKSYGSDSGAGYGWRVQIASIVPEMSGSNVIGYTFIDGTGAEYRMTQDGSVWRSLHGHYITWDPAQSVLWFANGSSMKFGSVAGPHEADAGTLYPTLVQDTNGNQVLVSYLAGMGQTGSNSSGRISQIQDARAGFSVSGQSSYVFIYSSDPQPRLLSIVNTVGSMENYTFSYAPQRVSSPFTQDKAGGELVTMLASVTDGTGLQHTFQYNGYGELTQAQKPLGGTLGWNYRTYSFQDGRSIREVSSRSLSDPYSPTNTHTHSFGRDSSDGSGTVHGSMILTEPTGSAQKRWTFSSQSGSPYLGHAVAVEALSAGKVARSKSLVWSSTDAGIPYVSSQATVLDPGTPSQKTASHRISRDAFGNVTSHSHFEYDKNDSPARVTTHKHLTDQAYLDRHILNRRNSTTVEGNGEKSQIHSLQYDTTPIIDRPGLTQHDSSTFNTGNTLRGNVTESYVGGVYHRVQYDITGKPSVIQDSTQGQISLVPAAGSNNVHLGMVIPNGNENLGMQVEYAGGKPFRLTLPNGNQTAQVYDNMGRPAARAYSNGLVLGYINDNDRTATTTPNGRWKKATRDGFGRVIKTESGDASGTHSLVEHVYGPAANAPMGRLLKKSLPHAAGADPQWINVAYDDLGRKVSQDSASTGVPTTFSYSGNSVKTTDPAGRWKKVVRNASGKIKSVVMPDASGTSQLETQYSYNVLGKLTSVAMPRAKATQKRSFAYDAGGRVVMKHHAESGPKTSVYNPDGTLASMTDAKGQKHVYTRDAYKRITSVTRFNAKGEPQPNDSYSYYRDTNPFDPAFSQNTQGRLAAVQWGSADSLPGLMTEMYSYTVSGQMTAKRLRLNRGGQQADLELHVSYDGEGRVASVTYPSGDPSLTYTYDSMGRLNGVSTASDAVVKDVAYDALGNLTSMQLLAKSAGQYLVQGYEYNTRNRATRLIAAPADPTVADGQLPSVDLEYKYRSDDGKLLTETDHVAGKSVSYDYDNHGRIASAESGDSAWGLKYDYDEFGNRTSQTVTKGQGYSHEARHDPATNWMLDDSTDYDANGNIVLLPNMHMSYDSQNRLVRVDGINGSDRYGYNHKNLRVWTRAADGSESFSFYHGTRNLATYTLATDASGNLSFSVVKTNIYFGKRLAQSGGDVAVADRLGSTRAWSAKKDAKTASYTPFGEKVQGQDDANSKFDGYEEDVATGLKYAEQRYYSSTLGRFMSPDPYEKSAHLAEPNSWNRYAFVSNDPINRTDPHGLNDGNSAYNSISWDIKNGNSNSNVPHPPGMVGGSGIWGGAGSNPSDGYGYGCSGPGGDGGTGGGDGGTGGGDGDGGGGGTGGTDGGGGAPNTSVVITDPGFNANGDATQSLQNLNEAANAVEQILGSDNSCSQLFNNSPLLPDLGIDLADLFDEAPIIVTSNSNDGTGVGAWVNSGAEPGDPIYINAIGPAFSTGSTYPFSLMGGPSVIMQAGSVAYDELALLHEFAHQLQVIPNDAGNTTVSILNNIVVYNACQSLLTPTQ
jgi:RHS repeat-associated protein